MTTLTDIAELVRAPAALSVPGDALAGAAFAGTLGARAAGLSAASVCLYWSGMAANDWADRDLDARERPERPVPAGRVTPGTALGVAAAFSAAGLALAGLTGGRRALAVAVPLAGAVWCYDLRLKGGPAGPAAMAVCRGLDVLLGASSGQLRRAAVPALTIAAHTYTVTALSRREVTGGGPFLPAATLAGTAGVAAVPVALAPAALMPAAVAAAPAPTAAVLAAVASASLAAALTPAALTPAALTPAALTSAALTSAVPAPASAAAHGQRTWWRRLLPGGLAGWYAASYGIAQVHALTEPSAGNMRAAVGAGITGLPALQGALIARSGAPAAAVVTAAAAPLGRRLARWLSPT